MQRIGKETGPQIFFNKERPLYFTNLNATQARPPESRAKRHFIQQRELLLPLLILEHAVEFAGEEVAAGRAQPEDTGRDRMKLLLMVMGSRQQVLEVGVKQVAIRRALLLGLLAQLAQLAPVAHLEAPRMHGEPQILPGPILAPGVLGTGDVMRVQHPLLVGGVPPAPADGDVEMTRGPNQFIRPMTDAKHGGV